MAMDKEMLKIEETVAVEVRPKNDNETTNQIRYAMIVDNLVEQGRLQEALGYKWQRAMNIQERKKSSEHYNPITDETWIEIREELR